MPSSPPSGGFSEAAPELPDPLLDGLVKGWPALGCRVSELTPGSLTVADLPTPTVVLDDAALGANIAAMAEWCSRSGFLLAPHAKTSMAPALLRRQLEAGAWGLTVADVRQARVAVATGAANVLIANEVLDPRALDWVAGRREGETLICVDSAEGVRRAEEAARRGVGRLSVLVELGYPDGRCGVRDRAAAMHLAREVAATEALELGGLELYEGLISDSAGTSARSRVDDFLRSAAEVATEIAPLVKADRPLLSAGGSAYFDRVAAILGPAAAGMGWELLLRSGCYLTHDHGLYARTGPQGRGEEAPELRPAIELRATVLSRPQPDRAILDCGRRDVSYDADLPVVLDADARAVVVALNDQHAHLCLDPDSEVAVGDVLRLGVSHPCTTLERWRVLPLVDRSGRVLAALPTCF